MDALNKTTINHIPEQVNDHSVVSNIASKPSKEQSDKGLNGVTVNNGEMAKAVTN